MVGFSEVLIVLFVAVAGFGTAILKRQEGSTDNKDRD